MVKNPYREGYLAGKYNKSITECPYEAYSQNNFEWIRGWEKGALSPETLRKMHNE